MVHAPDPKLFEQAIFILKDNVGEGITDEALLKEARRAIQRGDARPGKRKHVSLYGAAWAAGGSLVTGLIWLLSAML